MTKIIIYLFRLRGWKQIGGTYVLSFRNLWTQMGFFLLFHFFLFKESKILIVKLSSLQRKNEFPLENKLKNFELLKGRKIYLAPFLLLFFI